jgi:hypothetical protein
MSLTLGLQNTGFQLPQHVVISLRRLFGMEELLFDLSSYPIPESPDDLKTRSCKNIRRNKNAPTTKHANNCTSSLTLKGHLRQVTMTPHPGFECIITLDSGIPPKVQQYMITIGKVLGQTWLMGKLQASLFCLHYHRQPRL